MSRTDHWNDLVDAYHRDGGPVPVEMRAATLAQWALESGWGRSKLAADHNNFAGLKWRPRRVSEVARPVEYEAHDGVDTYCHFDSPEEFILGYWMFIDGGPYDGWSEHVDDARAYLSHVQSRGYSTTPDYVDRVMRVVDDLTKYERTGTR